MLQNYLGETSRWYLNLILALNSTRAPWKLAFTLLSWSQELFVHYFQIWTVSAKKILPSYPQQQSLGASSNQFSWPESIRDLSVQRILEYQTRLQFPQAPPHPRTLQPFVPHQSPPRHPLFQARCLWLDPGHLRSLLNFHLQFVWLIGPQLRQQAQKQFPLAPLAPRYNLALMASKTLRLSLQRCQLALFQSLDPHLVDLFNLLIYYRC